MIVNTASGGPPAAQPDAQRASAGPLVDRWGRPITYLRVSVTDRCNYRCSYCMPEEGVAWKPRDALLTYEQITAIVAEAARLGITKVRLTGGEPLVRRDIAVLVRMIAAIPGMADICMTTNGSLLTPDLARDLHEAGLRRVNISLDTLDPARFRMITRGGDVREVIAGIDAALSAGLHPVKVNMVLFEDTTEDEINRMRGFCRERGAALQTISRFSIDCRRDSDGSPHADRPHACASCNRLRLTADGFLKPCLFCDEEIAADPDDCAASIREAVARKPRNGVSCRTRTMSQIGG